MTFSSLLSIRSHPMRVRGLKLRQGVRLYKFFRSHPMRVRGLKPVRLAQKTCYQRVAPHAGAWIETPTDGSYFQAGNVAPHAGAWIETS